MKRITLLILLAAAVELLLQSCRYRGENVRSPEKPEIDSVGASIVGEFFGCEFIEKTITAENDKYNKRITTLTYEIQNPTLFDSLDIENHAVFVLANIEPEPAKIDTFITDVTVRFKMQDNVREVRKLLRDFVPPICKYFLENKDTVRYEKWSDEGIRRFPMAKDILQDRAWFYIGMKSYGSALPFLLKLQQIEDDKEVEANIAVCFERIGETKKADSVISRCIEKNVVYERAYRIRGDFFETRKQMEEAEKDYRFAYSMDTTSYDNLLSLSAFYFNSKQYKKAAPYLERMISEFPEQTDAYFMRGQIRAVNLQKAKACEDLQKLLDLGGRLPQGFEDYCESYTAGK